MKLPQAPPDWRTLISTDALDDPAFGTEWRRGPAPGGTYRHWDTLRRIEPPPGLTPEHVWAARKLARSPLYRPVEGLRDRDGQPFQYVLADPVLERLHRLDRTLAGSVALPEPVTNAATRESYIVRSLMDEAITSSQLEGAATTRAVAREMLRTGRPPRDRSEQMILNNYRAMQYVREHVGAPLTLALVEELRQIVVENTLDDDDAPAFRQPGDGIAVYDDQNVRLHLPPSADEIPERMERMCRFANEAAPGAFLHPAVKAVVLHFWLAYDHPFTDGNGRAARALFYWSMLREGFWLAEYLSISPFLARAPARYARSFLYTETDDNDLTYFILAQLRVIEQAIEQLQQYVQGKAREAAETKALLTPASGLNHRQIALLTHATRNPGAAYTFASHGRSHGVAYATARADLLDLATRGVLAQQKQGKRFVFVAPPDVADRLRQL